MCKLEPIKTNYGSEVLVADIKKGFIEQVIKSAELCPIIEKVIIFGSASRVDCTEKSDVDIVVFTPYDSHEWLVTEDAFRFIESLFYYNEEQDYDLITRNFLTDDNSLLGKNILKGMTIYVK